MATFIMETADIGAGYIESLASRLAGGGLPVPYALLCATDIATALRDYHHKGLAHGDVNPGSIRLRESGARLDPRGHRSRSADARSDVSAFGAVLYQMITGREPPSDVPPAVFTPVRSVTHIADVESDAIRLASRCLDGSADMRQVVIELRILGLLTRGLAIAPPRLQVVARPVTVVREPRRLRLVDKSAAVAPEAQCPQVGEMPATALSEVRRLQFVARPAAAATEPQLPENVKENRPQAGEAGESASPTPEGAGLVAVAQALPPADREVVSASQSADTPCAAAPDAAAPDAALEPPVPATVLCPRCGGDAPLMPPRSIFGRLLHKIRYVRQCDLCGYRYTIIRFPRR